MLGTLVRGGAGVAEGAPGEIDWADVGDVGDVAVAGGAGVFMAGLF